MLGKDWVDWYGWSDERLGKGFGFWVDLHIPKNHNNNSYKTLIS